MIKLDEDLPPPSAAPAIVPRPASTTPTAPLSPPSSPQIAPAYREPAIGDLQRLIIQLSNHPEMKNYPFLTPLLQMQLEVLLELSDSNL